MVERGVEERDVVPAGSEVRIVEVPEAVVDPVDGLPLRLAPRVSERGLGDVERVDLGHDVEPARRALEGPEAASPGHAAREAPRRVDALEPVQGPLVRGARDAAIDGLAAERMRHPVGGVAGLFPVLVPVLRGLRGRRFAHGRKSSSPTRGSGAVILSASVILSLTLLLLAGRRGGRRRRRRAPLDRPIPAPVPGGCSVVLAVLPFVRGVRLRDDTAPARPRALHAALVGAGRAAPFNPYLNDVVTQMLPWTRPSGWPGRAGSCRCATAGTAAGTPLAANSQSAAFSPFTLLRAAAALWLAPSADRRRQAAARGRRNVALAPRARRLETGGAVRRPSPSRSRSPSPSGSSFRTRRSSASGRGCSSCSSGCATRGAAPARSPA